MASLYKTPQAYGPGKPASAAWAAILNDKKPKIKKVQSAVAASDTHDVSFHKHYQTLMDSMLKLTGVPSEYFGDSSNKGYWYGLSQQSYGYAPVTDFSTGYYAEVGAALGFTKDEIYWLVQANDQGLSFATIAALIDEHPEVLSSVVTARRKVEEQSFIANVKAAITHHQGPPKYAGLGGVISPKKKSPGWYVNDDIVDSLSMSMSNWKNSFTTSWFDFDNDLKQTPKHGLVLPKNGAMAKLLGIWTP